MRKTPLVPVALALMAGILTSHLAPSIPQWLWLSVMTTAALAVGLLLLVRHDTDHTYLPLLFFLFGLGGLLCHRIDPQTDPYHWSRGCPPQAMLEVRLIETPVPRERSWRVMTEVEQVDGRATRGRLQLYLRRDSTAATLRYGDRLLLHAWPDTAVGSLYATSDHYLLLSRDSTSLRARSEHMRMRLLQRMQAGPLAQREAGIAEALTLGWRADLDPEVRDSFREAGIAHLLAVSGLHVGLLTLMVGLLLFWTGKERRGRILRGSVQLAAVWSFALLTGLAPSTTRAALMFSLFIVADILGRRTDALNLLAASAIITLTANPLLITDVGWQLSYAAMTGLLLARPVIRWRRNRLWQTAIASIAATLATTPITTLTFHRFQPYFLIANILIIPLAGVMLMLSLLYMALPCDITAWPLGYVMRAVESTTALISSLPGATIMIPPAGH